MTGLKCKGPNLNFHYSKAFATPRVQRHALASLVDTLVIFWVAHFSQQTGILLFYCQSQSSKGEKDLVLRPDLETNPDQFRQFRR